MRPRSRLSITKAVAAVLFIAPFILTATGRPPHEREFNFEYAVTVQNLPSGAKTVDLWIPVPRDTEFQRVSDLQIETPLPYQRTTDRLGNTMLHLRAARPEDGSIPLTMRFHAVRRERIQALTPAVNARPETPPDLSRYLQPDRLVPIDGQIRTWARQVADQAHARTDLEKARAIYDHVVATVKYDKTGKGWGRGDIYYACENRRGNCTDFHAIFIGYARALGIPARFAIGFPLPPERGSGRIAGYHCWAEFYAQGIGWVPVDASEAAKNPDKRDYFFGAHDENRIEFTRGRDLVLAPPQAGDPLNYFIYPYAEVDGKKYDGLQTSYSWADTLTVAQR